MHLEVLVEEPSAEAAITTLLPTLVSPGTTWCIHAHQGKADLLTKLPQRLRGYSHWMPDDWRIVVLVDEDRQDCVELKGRMERAAVKAGLATRASPDGRGRFQVVNRIAVEELEAWYFGDETALRTAYPRLTAGIGVSRKFRDPDAIRGGTWEQLEVLLRRAGYYPGGLPKIEAARLIAPHMDPPRNRSRSFQCFRAAIEAPPSPAVRKQRLG